MNNIKTTPKLIEELEDLASQKKGQAESQILIQLLKLVLQTNKKQFVALTEKMEDGFAHCKIIYDKTGVPHNYKFLSVNKAFEKQSGLTAAETVGKTILEIFPNANRNWIDFYLQVAQTQQPNSATKYSHNAKRHYASSACSTSKEEFIMLFKDVTESVELATANKEVIKSQEQNSAVLANMQEAFSHCEIICDENGKPIDYRILAVNAAWKHHTGLNSEDIVGKRVLEFFPDIEKSWIKILGKVALFREPHSFVHFSHNTQRYYQASAFSPEKGEFALFLRDITDQETKRLELEKAYLKAEENDKLKSAFLANMSHEIRTPMNAILGFSGLLEDDAISAEDKKECLKQIKSSGNQLLTIISDIVDISKIESKQQKLVFVKCDLHRLFDDLFSRYSVLNKNPRIALKIEKETDNKTFTIITDEIRLTQIFSNLIENALKFTLSGEVVIGYSLKGEDLQFYVRDTGIGIKEENQKVVFERFGQIKNKNSPTVSGTGLGIPIAKGLTNLLGGHLWLESEFKKGSTFYFSIPYNPSYRDTTNKGHKYTILIAEDDDVNFLLLNLWLNSHFNIVRATNGFEAVHQYEKNDSIDLIIMDTRMPYMDGVEATKEIRKIDMHVPIIAHTAYAMNEESFSMKLAGCDQVLIKPITRNELLEVLAKYNLVV